MNRLQHYLLLMLLICGTIASYVYGVSSGAIAFVIIGVLLECLFWFKALSNSSNKA